VYQKNSDSLFWNLQLFNLRLDNFTAVQLGALLSIILEMGELVPPLKSSRDS